MVQSDAGRPAGRTSRRQFLKTSATAVSGVALGGLALEQAAHAAGTDVIRIGVVGCGGRGPGAAADAMSVDPGIRLVALADLFMDRVKAARNNLKGQRPDQVAVDDDHCFAGFDGYRKVIESVDVVLIACAAKFHPMYAKAALEAGKHVFVEKPHAIDPLGVKVVIAAAALAKEKNLSLVSGLQSRYHPGYQEAVKRIHDGAIGDIVAIEENFLRPPYVLVKRAAGLNEVQYQCSNQYHFNWLSGDDVPQSLIHNVDRSLWAMREQTPAKCHALAGRSAMFDEIYGNVFDHHAVVYEFAGGVKLYAFCRTTTGCYDEVSSLIAGTKGRCNLLAGRIDGETKWQYQGPDRNPYQEEHRALFQAVRSGTPVNSGPYMVNATLATVMGQLSCYTGKEVTWDQAAKSDFFYPPKPEACSVDMDPPVKPGPNGQYPVYVPGQTKLL
ncbi:MAG: Gfo/Idh/MocA family oxidoreductase [Planctomycetes bacterium]|nr:Gfo/Idh/MocA family oxidoreductase [Planctomycetota bacterium]